MDLINLDTINNKIIELRNQKVILDSNVAELYGIETKHINQAVNRNIEKFPDGYLLEITEQEWDSVKSQIVTSPLGGGKVKKPKAFTKKGLYMLATILKSPKATAATIQIIEAYAKIREINHTIIDIVQENNDKQQHLSLTNHVGKLIGELIMPNDEELETISIESEAKLKFLTMLEFSRKVIKKPKK